MKGLDNMRIKFELLALLVPVAMLCSNASAQTISVNFHVDGDEDAQADHELTAGEVAGFVPVDGASWNNISVGTAAAHNTAEAIFAATNLTDDTGNATAATIAPSVDSTWFVGYAASSAGNAVELGLEGNDDDLFNSYLALNGPSGDGTPADAAILSVTGLGETYTSGGYDLIIYSDSDRGGANANPRTSTFTVTPAGGAAITSSIEDNPASVGDSTFDGTFVLSNDVAGDTYENYVVVSGLTAASFDLEITSADGGRGAISGFQIRVASDLPFILGDASLNGVVDFDDIAPFITLLANGTFLAQADIDGSTVVDFDDIAGFIEILAAP